jgi:hypothetical protein
MLLFVFITPERIVTKKNTKQLKEQKASKSPNQPWISMRSGVKIMTVTSILMAILTAWQVIPSKSWLEGILWGLLFGALIWAIFFGNILINRLLRR